MSSPSFKIGTNLNVNLLSSENRKLNDDVKSKEVKTEPDVKTKVITKPNIEPNKEHKQDVKPNIKFNQDVKEPDTNMITCEEEKVALVLGITSVFTVWWMFK